jgi:hypothetical protein
MPPLSPFTVSLGGVKLSAVADPAGIDNPEAGAGFSGTYAPADATRAFVKRDVPAYIKRLSRGAGFGERRDEGDDDGYFWGEDIDTWSGNGIRPSGRRLNVGSGFGLAAAGAHVVNTEIFNGHLFGICATTGHCIRWPNADPTSVPVFDPALNSFGSGVESFAAGFIPKDIVVFPNAAGAACLYVSTYKSATGETRIYQRDTAGTWTNVGGILGYRADKMCSVWWEGRDGGGAERLLILSDGVSTVRHCIAGNDPTAGASYVTPVVIGNAAYPVTALIAAPQHAFAVKKNGIHDFNELHSWNLTPYWSNAQTLSWDRGALIYDDHIYATRGFDLDRYDLALEGRPQHIPGACGPGFLWQDGSPIVGLVTSLAFHDGWLLAAVYNPYLQTSYVLRAKDRRIANVDVPNPLVWHGAEQAITSGDILISHLRVTSNASSTFGVTSSYLWMFAAVGFSGLPTSDLYYAPLPTGGGALSTQASGGTFTYNPTARLYHTAQNWDDRNATKGVHRVDLTTRNTSTTATVEIQGRVDGNPTTITNPGTWTTQGTHNTTANSKSLSTALVGQSIALKTILTTPSPYTAPPLVHEISPRAHVVREALRVDRLWIVLDRDHELANGTLGIASADQTASSVLALQNQAATSTYIDPFGASHQVYVEQGINWSRVEIESQGPPGIVNWRTVMRVELSCVT